MELVETPAVPIHKPWTKYPIELWEQAREDFIAGRGRLADIAARYNMSVITLRSRSTAGMWSAERTARTLANRHKKRNGYSLPSPTPTNGHSAATVVDAVQRHMSQADVTEVLLDRLNKMMLECSVDDYHKLAKARTVLLEQSRLILGLANARGKREKGQRFRSTGQQSVAECNTIIPESVTPELEATNLSRIAVKDAFLSPDTATMPTGDAEA